MAHHAARWIFSLGLTLAAGAVCPLAAEDDRPLAVVSALKGGAWVTEGRGAARRELRLFDWLGEGARVEIGAASSLTVAFADGRRWEFEPQATVLLATDGPRSERGSIRALERVPAFPPIAAIADRGDDTARSGAVRIRAGDRVDCLYPTTASGLDADRAVLTFAPLSEAANYRIEIETESGRSVFVAETQLATLTVPAGVLKAGQRYYWRVRAFRNVGAPAVGEGTFRTLSDEEATRTGALRAVLEKRGDVESLALLGEIDRRLGLLVEAREAFRAAAQQDPQDQALRAALADVHRQLQGEGCEVP